MADVRRECLFCNQVFYVKQWVLNKRRKEYGENALKFCSQKCVGAWKKTKSHETRKCQECGIDFSFLKSRAGRGRGNRGKYCSKDCFHKGINKRITKSCEKCGILFEAHASKLDRKYCSKDCAGVARNRVKKICVECQTEYEVEQRRAKISKCCSFNCLIKYTAKLNTRYALDAKTRCGRKAWRKVRLQAIARDGGKCALCDTDQDLTVHHIVPWRKTKDDSLSNLITLCRSCHYKVEHLDPNLIDRIVSTPVPNEAF